MLELEEAVSRILAGLPSPVAQTVALPDADGRVLLESPRARIDLPPFDNSAMDGYAARAEDLRTARAERPVFLRLAGKVAAGEVFPGQVSQGTCVRVFTGSPLPAGTDTVVMQEDTRVEPDRPGEIAVLEPGRPWENIRLRGEDVKAGGELAPSGSRVGAGLLSLCAAAGIDELSVGCRPVVGLLATGTELREGTTELLPGQIFESNRIGLAALVLRAGGVPRPFALVKDTLAETRAALEAALQTCDIVVSSGGVSVGEMDFVKRAFEAAGGELQFWKVAVRPGKPFVFGRRGQRLLFGLPGNPVSAFVTFLLLVRPALLRWQGAEDVSCETHFATLAEPLPNPGDRRHFVRVKVERTGKVFSAGPQGSHRLASLAAANALVDVPPRTTLPTGSVVPVLRF